MSNSTSTAALAAGPAPLSESPDTACRCDPARHFVQFYESDEFLVNSVSQFVREGLDNNEKVLVVATGEHLDRIFQTLDLEGLEVDSLVEQGRFVALDAADILARLIQKDGTCDAKAFERNIDACVATLTSGGHRLRIFGEMVALLWADGNTDSALQLEQLWNGLVKRYDFSLLCAYPMKCFAAESSGQGFSHVCSAHQRVLPTEQYSVSTGTEDARLRAVAVLQQKAAALEAEIAERKRVELTLRRREAELTSLVETAALGVHWVDENGRILWANKAEFELLGYTGAEFIGRNIAEFHEDPSVIADLLARLRRGESVRNHEAVLCCKDGTRKTVLIDSSVLMDGDRFVHSQCFTRDITEQRRGEEATRYLAAIVEGSDDAIISKNLNGIITSWNPSATRIFGYTTEEAVGQPVTLLIPPDRLDEETDIISRLRRGERVDHFETLRRCKDGTLLDVSLTISPIKDQTGRIVGASKIARDITEKKRTEKSLEAAREMLARANEDLERRVEERTASLREAIAQLEEFSYTVSHDLRAPLRGMQVYSQALIEDYGATLDSDAQHCLDRIALNASRLDKMVMDVLAFSRISRAELRMERVSLDSLVRDIIQYYPGMQPPRAQIDVAVLDDVIGHEPSLIQVISNLLANAVKFVAPGVTPLVRIRTETTGDMVRLHIRDNGIGIRPDRQERLFRMFERLHPDLPYEGTGVGLAIVRKAAVRMGGDVGVQSDGTNGATFWVTLPAAKD